MKTSLPSMLVEIAQIFYTTAGREFKGTEVKEIYMFGPGFIQLVLPTLSRINARFVLMREDSDLLAFEEID